MRATCFTHLLVLDLITVIIFGEHYELRRSSLRSFLYTFVVFCLLSTNTLGGLCVQTSCVFVLLLGKDIKFHTEMKRLASIVLFILILVFIR